MTSPTSTPETAATEEYLTSRKGSNAGEPRLTDQTPADTAPAAPVERDAVGQVLAAEAAASAGPVTLDAEAERGPAEAKAAEPAAVTRLDPSAPRRGMGPGAEGGPRRPQGPGPGGGPRQGQGPGPAGVQGRPRPVGAEGGPRPQGQGGPRKPQDAAVVAVVPRHDGANSPDGQASHVVAAALPRNPAQIARNTAVEPIDDDAFSDAVSLPSKRPQPKPPAKPPLPDAYATYVPGPSAKPAQMRKRHWGMVLFFLLVVILPASGYGWYLYTRAADQYESDVGFGSRTEDAPATFSFLGALGGGGASSSSDMDILNQFIGSQEMVTRVQKKLDLRSIFSKATNDPLFAFPKDGSVEDLVAYWQSKVIPNYDSGTGLMSLRVYAFDPHDAQNIATAVLDESTKIINELSTTAQSDATKYSAETLSESEKRMSDAQKALTDFRIKNHIVDPSAQLAGASQVVNTLVQALGQAEIDLDMLVGTLPDNDPRILQLNRRIDVIQKRMDEENAKVGGLSDTSAPGYATLMVDYQNLQMEQDFAQKAYLAALSAYDQAVTDAQHKTRYLTTYLSPTLAESSTAPNRPLRVFLALLAGFLVWASAVMIYYALRDRR